MATIPGFPRITAAELSTGAIFYVAKPDATDPKDRSIEEDELVAYLGANGLVLVSTKDQANGVAGLDASAQLVGPIILSSYANAAAAGVLDDGELGVVADKLHLGDGSATGGVRVTGAAPSYHNVTATGSITVDPYASHTFIDVIMADASIVITISNLADIPNGHLIHVYAENTGSADQLTINGSVLDAITIGASATSMVIAKRSSGWTVTRREDV